MGVSVSTIFSNKEQFYQNFCHLNRNSLSFNLFNEQRHDIRDIYLSCMSMSHLLYKSCHIDKYFPVTNYEAYIHNVLVYHSHL